MLPSFMKDLHKKYDMQPRRVFAIWPEIIGEKLASMTKVVSFENGILLIKVKSSTLLSLFSQHEKKKLIKKIQEKLINITIRDIIFRIG